MRRKIIGERPFGYKNSKELYENYVKGKFNVLKVTENINDYYDYILAAGTLGYWIEIEKQYNKEINDNFSYKIINAIFNNIKHFKLQKRNYEIKRIVYGESLLIANENGKTIWDNKLTWDNSKNWYYEINGENSNIEIICTIEDKNSKIISYYLYEICKNVNELYKKIFTENWRNKSE